MGIFVLKKEYELQLPANYVDVEAEAMEYIDGGGWVYTAPIAWVVDGIAMALGAGWILAPIKMYGKKMAQKYIGQVTTILGKAIKWATGVSFGASTAWALGALTQLPNLFSLGGIASSLVDIYDGRLDGKIRW